MGVFGTELYMNKREISFVTTVIFDYIDNLQNRSLNSFQKILDYLEV